jgi:predicted glycosyltransferase
MNSGAGSLRRRNRFDLRAAAGRPENGCHDSSSATPRFLFYSNECVGLGHLRRCLRLARGLTEANPDSSALIVTGSPAATSYSLPPRVDLVKLPALARDEDGNHLPERLAVDVDVVSRVRSRLAVTVASEFDPTVAVIDKTPLGLRGELVPVLELLETRSCRLVLGLRDVEDAGESLRRRWAQAGIREALERWYDAILVYGPRTSVDALDCLGWHDLRIPVHHVGYVGQRMADRGPSDLPPDYLLATAGGGVDGYPLLSRFVEALHLRPLPCPAVVVAGPLMPAPQLSRLRERAGGLDVRVEQFREDMDSVIVGARAVVSMAGYNTVSELLIAGKAGLIVPGLRPSREQKLRAEMLGVSGMVHVLDPETLDPASMRAALDRLLESPPPRVELGHYHGAARATAIVTELAEGESDPNRSETATRHRRTPSPAGSGPPGA